MRSYAVLSVQSSTLRYGSGERNPLQRYKVVHKVLPITTGIPCIALSLSPSIWDLTGLLCPFHRNVVSCHENLGAMIIVLRGFAAGATAAWAAASRAARTICQQPLVSTAAAFPTWANSSHKQ